MNAESLKLYAITDRSWLKENECIEQVVEEAILGGATIIQFREKKLPYDELKEEAIKVQQVCKKYKVPFIVNDDVVLAKELDADGVHVGQSDATVREARIILGNEKIVGATAKTVEQARKAMEEGADYLGSGAIFNTTTKTDAKPMTKELLIAICNSVDIPVVAIGGIDETNVYELIDIPIAGVAVVSGIFAKKNPRRAASTIWDILYGKKIIHCITNIVTVNEVANVILAVGGSPIMAHNVMEVEEVQKFSSALLINLGATDDYEAIKIAYKTAINLGHPIVIDPVGVGGIKFRRDFLNSLLEIGSPTCIRGNFGEIKAVLNNETTMAGLDNQLKSTEDIVFELAKKLKTIVVATGETDIISDGIGIRRVSSGSPMQKMITGAGCMLSAVLATMFSAVSKPDINTAEYACKYMGNTAKLAAEDSNGSMSFLNSWVNLISLK